MKETTHSRRPGPVPKYRVNLTLPADLAVLLSETAQNMGISQSALLTSLLSDSLPALHRLSKRAKSLSDSDSVKRFRGESIDIILNHVRKALNLL